MILTVSFLSYSALLSHNRCIVPSFHSPSTILSWGKRTEKLLPTLFHHWKRDVEHSFLPPSNASTRQPSLMRDDVCPCTAFLSAMVPQSVSDAKTVIVWQRIWTIQLKSKIWSCFSIWGNLPGAYLIYFNMFRFLVSSLSSRHAKYTLSQVHQL